MTRKKKNEKKNKNICFEKSVGREVFTDNQARWIKKNINSLKKKDILEIFSRHSREFLDYKAMFPNFSVPFQEESKYKAVLDKIIEGGNKDESKEKIIEILEEECDIEIKNFMQKEGATGLDSLRKTLADSCRLIYIAEIYGYISRADIPLDNIIAKIADKY